MISRADRQHPDAATGAHAPDPFARDRNQIAHSPAFQRLRHVTQVMAPSQPGAFHNRLTHSMAVARIGRALALALLDRPGAKATAAAAGGLDATVVEAAALAHDLGHPPFGHDAEDELDHLLTNAGVADGFEANAQTLRIVSKLADGPDGPDGRCPGMNLTRATLAAILKYPWTRQGSDYSTVKFGAYESEAAELAWARALSSPDSDQLSLEAALVDWADLVAYAVHDFEDFVRAGLMPLERLTTNVAEQERFLGLVCQRRGIPQSEQGALTTIFERLLATCPAPGIPPASHAGRNALRCFSQHQINDAISGVSLAASTGPALLIAPDTRWVIYLLEGLTWHYVIDTELLKPQRDHQRKIIRALFGKLAEAAMSSRDRDQFPMADRERLQAADSESARLRVVADIIGSMSEGEAKEAI